MLPVAPLLSHCRSVECLKLVAPNALDKLGAFMRSLSAFYSLVDAERLIEESIARTKLGVPVKVPLHTACLRRVTSATCWLARTKQARAASQ